MKRLISGITAFLFSFPAFVLASDEARFMTNPDISGDRIVFTYDDDLWVTTVQGGVPVRITTTPGRETAAKFSPDGKWIAFSGTYQGASDIYLIPSEGGIPRRITWMPGAGVPVGWTPDGKFILFRSTYGRIPISRDPKLYKVSTEGTMPDPLPVERGVSCSFSEDGRQMLYVRKGNQDYYWKRYKGGQYPDIWLADFQTGKTTPVTDYVGRNAYPMWIGNLLYFSSDRGADGITNLYAMDLKSKATKQITNYTDFDVMWPSTDRKHIVFVQNGYLNVLDPKSGSPRKVTVRIAGDNWRLQERWVNISEYVHYFDVANDGKQLSLTARGDVYQVSLGEKDTLSKNLSSSPGYRESYARISPDGKKVAFFSDQTGEYQLYVQDLDGGQPIAITENLNRTS